MHLLPWKKIVNATGEKSLLAAMTDSPKPTPTSKIAAFDLDDTLISKQGARAGLLMWPNALPAELQRVRRLAVSVFEELVADSFTIVILSNQLFKEDKGKSGPSKQETQWCETTSKRLPQLNVPFYIYAATKRDYYRKPMPGMIEKHLELHNGGRPAHPDSFFVGDAAGRDRDHNDSDRKMALSVPMTFHTPEEYFLKAKPAKYALKRLHVEPLKTFEPEPFLFQPSPEPELVLLVGYPGSGKTTFFNDAIKQHGYQLVSSPTQQLHPNQRYVLEKRALSTAAGRSQALQQAKKAGLPVRLLRIDPLGESPNGAWRQLVWRHHCASTPNSGSSESQQGGGRAAAASSAKEEPPSQPASHNFFSKVSSRPEPLLSPREFAAACKGYTCPHPESEEAALFVNGVQAVPWTYRGGAEQKERFFRIWAETGDEKNKDLKPFMD